MGAATMPSSLLGKWGGEHVRLTISAQGGRIERDCASGSFPAPIALDAKGRFEVRGRFNVDQPGPSRADAPAGGSNVLYKGQVDGDTLELEVIGRGEAAPERYTLSRNRRTKLVRCL